ncbi:ArsC family reductase [Acidihalobacter prosperus]|uniref:Arsenate reductase n=1 Tax=Acidihalobacter prosperus TaxID=160660 RepID=A0A1A6C911_9GAMM|nr:ArsC family reductase [Acidihalobacter prosperus]OBS11052.1 arsenate reductase [Acidihalobacter prosperus]
MTFTLYGIRQCDTVKKARKWLDTHHVDYHFHDFRSDGLDPSLLQSWVHALGHRTLINRRGTTWRGLPDEVRANLDETRAIQLMLEHPTLIKRPVLTGSHAILVGFDEKAYARQTHA